MKFNRKLRLDRIGSATRPAQVGAIVEVGAEIVCVEGAAIAVRALGENRAYGEIELPTGRMAKVVAGNLIAGVLGARLALHGHMGTVPKSLVVGDTVDLLNIGGVLGISTSVNKHLGPPIPCQVLGQVVRAGKPVNIKDFSLPPCDALSPTGPALLLVLGTCMNSGKTFAACETIRLLTHAGVRIVAGKLSGVAALRDTLGMGDNGASATASFLDCGLPSTVNETDLARVARAVIAHLEKMPADIIVLELGDGIIGGYNTGSILADPSIRARTSCRILCANDLVGAWGGVQFLKAKDHVPEIISGPVTDNLVGTGYVRRELGLACANARNEPRELARHVADAMGLKVEIPAS